MKHTQKGAFKKCLERGVALQEESGVCRLLSQKAGHRPQESVRPSPPVPYT